MAKKIQTPEPAVDVTTAEVVTDENALETAAADMVREARAATQVFTNAEIAGIAQMGQFVGMARYAEFMETTNRVARLKTLLHLKDTGKYKKVPMQNIKGEIVSPKSFDELCVAMGTSRAKVEEDARNLSAFGDKLLEEQKNLGIGYRELRALRSGIEALPADEQGNAKDRLTQAVESGDKTAVRELLEDFVEEKKVLAKKLSDAKKATRAAEEQAAVLKGQRDEKSNKANELEMKLTMALNPSSEDERQKNLADARAEFRVRFEEKYRAIIGAAGSLCILVANGSNMDRCPELLDVALREYMGNRVSHMCQELRGLILGTGLDVDFEAEYDLEAFTGMRGELDDFMPEPDDSQQ